MSSGFYGLYNFDDNLERTKKVLEKFNIDKYHFMLVDGITALTVDINLNTYRICLDTYNEEMVVRKKRITRRGCRHTKEYMPIVKSFNEDCIYNSLKFIYEDNRT